MADQWMIKGREYGNCNCHYGCPCQFSSPTTHGYCEAVLGGIIDEGRFNEVGLDGLTFVLILQWPGEIAAGNGKEQAIIDEGASADQREALRKILHGESTAAWMTHFVVYNSTMSEVLDTLYRPVDVSIDVEPRRGSIRVDDLAESTGVPIKNPFSGADARSRIHLPEGFEYTYAEMGSGTSKVTTGITMDLKDSYGQFSELHMNQDGVIR